MLYKTSNRTHVLYLQIFKTQNYILFKVTASGSVFSRYSQTSRKPPHKIRRLFGRLNENRTTEGLPRKGPNTVTFWVSNCYDMCSLCGRRLKGKGKGVWGAREKRGAHGARFSRAWPETSFPFLPSPPRPPFFCSRSNFSAIIRLETFATQAICLVTLIHEYSRDKGNWEAI